MQWRKLGLIYGPDGTLPWAATHAMIPTPLWHPDGMVRVYVTCCDVNMVGRPGYVDLDPEDPTRVIARSEGPLLDVGAPGHFDQDGVLATSVLPLDDRHWLMYYVGFERGTWARYRLLTGLAISEDGGGSFRRHGPTPVLERSSTEAQFRCGPFVRRDGETFRMWYVAGSEWIDLEGKSMPVYTLKYAESDDGVTWPACGRQILEIGDDEHGFGRPWVVGGTTGGYEMFYSIRRRSLAAYRLGYANSTDGVDWCRRDEDLNLDVGPDAWDSQAIMYAATLEVNGRSFCFYNGNDFGRNGFGVAERVG